jgi:hypothetical protein
VSALTARLGISIKARRNLLPVLCARSTLISPLLLLLLLPLQLDQSLLHALQTEIQAKAEIKGNLDTYKYYDNVSADGSSSWLTQHTRHLLPALFASALCVALLAAA